MYNPDYGFIQQGWECPKCHRIYSPTQSFCLYCNDRRVTYSTATKSDWFYKDNSRTDDIYDNEWWKYPSSIAWEDMIQRTGLLEDD